MKLLLLLLSLLLVDRAAAEEVLITLSDGTELPLEHLQAEGDRVLLWLPSEFGYSARQQAVAEALASKGVEVWMPDFHTGYFIAAGRYSLQGLDPGLVLELMQEVQRLSGKQLYLFVSGRMAVKALQSVHRWQQAGLTRTQFGGFILVSPKLYTQTPQGGEEAEFEPVAYATSLPVYLFQPQNAAQYWRIKQVQEVLASGGSSVYLQTLKGVADGFHLRPLHETEPAEVALTARLHQMLDHAMDLLAAEAIEDFSARAIPTGQQTIAENQRSNALLKTVPNMPAAPALKLNSLNGELYDLETQRGRVVVLNFWTTWCPPCVEELPSLERLRQLLAGEGVAVVAVDVGEPAESVRNFLQDKKVAFPVLLDSEAEAFTAWKSYAFPTTFILDREHRIRYAVFGAFAWDDEEVIRTLRQLLETS